ncbi:MAG: T9SS type A sorting domain-containing protein [Candidatus Kapabacteria bacterium]|nr:T9SS type A sorting domain-containing protein [Candidatus Kapabacteria bacterium]
MPLMQSYAIITGRRAVQRGDTAMYRMRVTTDVTMLWTVVGGTLETSGVTSEQVVKWAGADSVGTVTVVRTWPGGCSDVTSFKVRLPVVLGVDEDVTSVNEFVSVWPNPTSDECSISWTGDDAPLRYEVVDLQGRQVRAADMSSNTASFATSELAVGQYAVKIHTAAGVHVKRFIVKR